MLHQGYCRSEIGLTIRIFRIRTRTKRQHINIILEFSSFVATTHKIRFQNWTRYDY